MNYKKLKKYFRNKFKGSIYEEILEKAKWNNLQISCKSLPWAFSIIFCCSSVRKINIRSEDGPISLRRNIVSRVIRQYLSGITGKLMFNGIGAGLVSCRQRRTFLFELSLLPRSNDTVRHTVVIVSAEIRSVAPLK